MTCSTSENVEFVRAIAASWERGEYDRVEWAAPDIVFEIADGPEPGRRSGAERLAPSLIDFRSAWADYRSEALEFHELDDDRVLVLTYVTGRGRSSGIEIAEQRANLFGLRDGKVTSLVVYWDRERALTDVALPSLLAV
jgi:ketosteroid isomerase-like protein